jgi:hypothetical protein
MDFAAALKPKIFFFDKKKVANRLRGFKCIIFLSSSGVYKNYTKSCFQNGKLQICKSSKLTYEPKYHLPSEFVKFNVI